MSNKEISINKFTHSHEFSYLDMETKCRLFMNDIEIELDHAAKLLNAKDNKIAELEEERDRLLNAVIYCTSYLDDNKLNCIGSGSKAHNELKAVELMSKAKALKEQN